MRSPCHRCSGLRCVIPDRKKDCLEPYPGLRAIGNSSGGFKGTSYAALDHLSAHELNFYHKMTGHGKAKDLL